MKTSESTSEIYKALVGFHKEASGISIRKSADGGGGRYKYATLDDILDAIRLPLANQGLFLTQGLHGDWLITRIAHVSGEYIQTDTKFISWEGRGGTSNLQNMGGGITYLKRYALSAILGISLDDDNDGANSNYQQRLTQQPVKKKQKPRITKQALDGAIESILNAPNGLDYTVARIKGKYVINQTEEAAIVAAIEARKRTDKLAEVKAAKAKDEPEAPTDQIPF